MRRSVIRRPFLIWGMGWLAAAAALIAPDAVAADDAQQWGHLSGRLVYDGEPPEGRVHDNDVKTDIFGKTIASERLLVNEQNRGLAGVVVFLVPKEDATVPVHPSYDAAAKAKVELRMVRGRFEPHMLLMRVGQTLVLSTKDNVTYAPKLNWIQVRDAFPALLTRDGGAEEMRPTREEMLPVGLHDLMHPWMDANLLLRKSPYMAKTDADGRFTIKNLPVDQHTFRLWHEEAGYVREIRFGTDDNITFVKRGLLDTKIAEGENDLGELRIPPTLFEERKK